MLAHAGFTSVGKQWPIQVYVFTAPQFHKSMLIPSPAGLTVEAYGSAKLTSYLDQVLKNLKFNEKEKIKMRENTAQIQWEGEEEKEREVGNNFKRMQSPSSSWYILNSIFHYAIRAASITPQAHSVSSPKICYFVALGYNSIRLCSKKL